MTGALKIGLIGGAGWLGSAITSAMLEAGVTTAENLTLSYRSKKPDILARVNLTQDNQALADASDVVVLCVRPDDWTAVDVNAGGKLIISVIAGVSMERLAVQHRTDRVVRALPNAAAEIRKSFTPWIASAKSSDSDRATVRTIFGACGIEDEVTSERDIDYFTALTGSGSAFPALLADAMMQHAIEHGITPEVARKAARMVIIGAGGLMEKTSQSPTDIVRSFIDYRGTTAAALETMLANGFNAAVANGINAGFLKANALGGSS
ncbi:pyrroline-5-carboxylate reductase family protein [Brucella cytisi]|uniref:pyrroline-5-carboxylate reductase family protein n=1 Tax=Brucella cytisi TaxID=407152 RepID=UPI0035E221CD